MSYLTMFFIYIVIGAIFSGVLLVTNMILDKEHMKDEKEAQVIGMYTLVAFVWPFMMVFLFIKIIYHALKEKPKDE